MLKKLVSVAALLLAALGANAANLGDYAPATNICGKFPTFRPSTGATFTLAGTPALSVYKDNSATQSTTGVTLTADFDSVTGLNHFCVDTSADGTFYAAGSNFDVVITTGTVDSVSVTGAVVAQFTLNKTAALRPTTAARTLDVTATGGAGIDWGNVEAPTTTNNLSGTSIATTQAVASVSGAVGSVTGAVGSIAAGGITEASYATTAGSLAPLRIVDQGTAQSATGTTLVLRAAAAFADDELIGSIIVITGGSAGVGQSKVITDYVSSTDTATVSTWQTTPTGTITYKVFAEPAGSAGAVSISAGGITSSSFAAGAIDASAIAPDAIGASEIASSAIGAGEIADGAIDEATFATTAGSFDSFGVVDQGTAQGVSGTTLQLRSAATFADDEIIGATCVITGGSTGVGQARAVTDYVSSTDTATVATWTTTPTGTITYECFGTAAGNASAVTIAAGGISAASFQAGAVDAAAIAPDAIGSSEIAPDAIGASEFADNTIDAGAIATDSIGASEIAASAIGSSEIADGGITSAEFASGAINATVIATDAFGAAEFAADAVTEVQSGLATAAALATVAGYIDTEVAALLTGVNVTKMNGNDVCGSGDAGDEWTGCP